ncbi:uncharacterized protein EV420DRAFT_1480242 [Desarmillaria tabescens]|uniref:Uncharacterized protein n=1 Tax=Armillaria tabescens TaxID=1929756 RepID=A0AA39N4R3_ARMTA|nr:uncharacterized protein EV420DRAFT_1480242 [Desarmillaria tabescens]KAK0458086.1 hypothetical protein EV420DRAFT_1480242 [Desarmillaria tabescens]
MFLGPNAEKGLLVTSVTQSNRPCPDPSNDLVQVPRVWPYLQGQPAEKISKKCSLAWLVTVDMQMIGFASVSALALGAFILGKQSMARRKKMELQCYRESIEKGRENGTPAG